MYICNHIWESDIHSFISTFLHISIYESKYVHVNIYRYTHTRIHTRVHRCVHACVHMCIHTHTCTYIMHIHAIADNYIHLRTKTYNYIQNGITYNCITTCNCRQWHAVACICIQLHATAYKIACSSMQSRRIAYRYDYIQLHTITYNNIQLHNWLSTIAQLRAIPYSYI